MIKNINYWNENVIVPLKRHMSKEIELRLEAKAIEQLLQNCYDADTQE